MEPQRLTEAAFRATFAYRMREMPRTVEGVDVEAYAQAIPGEDLAGLQRLPGVAPVVQRDAHDRYDHVLWPLDCAGVSLVIVVDVKNRWIHGHHVLDLRARP